MTFRILFLFLVTARAKHYKFVLCPKRTNSLFFNVSRDGCLDQASLYQGEDTVECQYVGPVDYQGDGLAQAQIVTDLLYTDIDGIAVSVINGDAMAPVLLQAKEQGIPVVTFDSDSARDTRLSYVGTDNYFFGVRLAKALKQLHPLGGKYAIMSDRTPNILQREAGVRDELMQSKYSWIEVLQSPMNANGDYEGSIEQMRTLATAIPDITAIVPVFGAPMFLEDLWIGLADEFRHVSFVVADDLPVQLALLARGKAAGLVGQMPYEMGLRSIDSLYKVAAEGKTLPDFQGTNVLEHIQIPLVLPPLQVDDNKLGGWVAIGYTLFGIVVLTVAASLYWTITNRQVRVVKIAQPEFLMMLSVGTLVIASSLVPLSIDDSSPNFTAQRGRITCMSVPWLLCLGFTIAFSAVFAKTSRVNRLFRREHAFQRIEVKKIDVLLPFAGLMASNIITLLCWSLIDPLEYLRKDKDGLDAWGRVIATYGTCESENAVPYLVILVLLNLSVLCLSNYQVYRARNLRIEFSESKYVGMVVGSMLQVFLLGVPTLLVVQELPGAYYLTFSLMIFVISIAILGFVFVPKYFYCKKFKMRSQKTQRRIIFDSIKASQRVVNNTTEAANEFGDGILAKMHNASKVQRIQEYPSSDDGDDGKPHDEDADPSQTVKTVGILDSGISEGSKEITPAED